jgi:hypothetical protein
MALMESSSPVAVLVALSRTLVVRMVQKPKVHKKNAAGMIHQVKSLVARKAKNTKAKKAAVQNGSLFCSTRQIAHLFQPTPCLFLPTLGNRAAKHEHQDYISGWSRKGISQGQHCHGYC